MLRDFVYHPDSTLIQQVLDRFDLTLNKEHGFALIEFQVLSPDSFVWRLLVNNAVYYLYAEDYIEGLEYVKDSIASYAVPNVKFDFVKAKQQESFDDASPVKNATVYEAPENPATMMQFAVSSGHDFVFLCKSDEAANRALFNN